MSSKKKELTIQETFYNLCKDLIRYIDKKIVRKYISPNQAQIPKEKRNQEKKYNDNKWRYFFEDEETTEEERIKDIFKDNNFLLNLQKLNDELSLIVTKMEENKKNKENLEKKIQEQNEKSKLYGEINKQLIKYFMEHNKNLNCINQNDIKIAFEEIKTNNIINNLNSDIIELYINNMNNNNIEIKKENNKNNKENINNEIIINENKKINNIIIDKNKKNNLSKSNTIPLLTQALHYLNQNKKAKLKQKEKNKLIKNIFESDSDDSSKNDDEKVADILNIEEKEKEEEEGEEEEEDEEHETIKHNMHNNEEDEEEEESENYFLSKKVKRGNN